MAKKPGNPKNGRRLQGVPKAGPLFVNGVEVPKGNVQKAVSRMYRSASRSLAEANEPAEVTIDQARHAQLDDHRCRTCEHAWWPTEMVAWEPATGRWWHMANQDGRHCRAEALQQHTPET